MKTFLKFAIVSFALIIGSNVYAQNYKFGHIDGALLMEAMPESDSAKVTLQRLQKTYSDQIEMLQVELQTKYQEYQNTAEQLTDLLRQNKTKELQDLQARIQQFQGTAQQDLQQQNQALFQPIIEKAKTTINKVAKANGLIYVFDISTGSVFYYSDDSIDLLPMVKKELGITK